MATFNSLKTKIQGLIDKSNTKTGKTDLDLTNAVDSLISGYGTGKDAKLITKVIDSNGTYKASNDGADGYSQVTVAVPSVVGDSIVGTWVFNDIIDIEGFPYVELGVDFECNGTSYNKMGRVESYDDFCAVYNYMFRWWYGTGNADYYHVYGLWYGEDGWTDDYKTITITGGVGVTNPAFITWLKANAFPQRSGIITVDELPTENIDKTAIYQRMGPEFKTIVFTGADGVVWANVYESLLSFWTSAECNHWYVPTLPTTNIKVSVDGVVYNFYYVEDEKCIFLYIDNEWKAIYNIFGDDTDRYDISTITDIKQATESDSVYALVEPDESYYQYVDKKLQGVIFYEGVDTNGQQCIVIPETTAFGLTITFESVATKPENPKLSWYNPVDTSLGDEYPIGEIHLYFVEDEQDFFSCWENNFGEIVWLTLHQILLDEYVSDGVDTAPTFGGIVSDIREIDRGIVTPHYYALFSNGFNRLIPEQDIIVDVAEVIPSSGETIVGGMLSPAKHYFSGVRVEEIPSSYVEPAGTYTITNNGLFTVRTYYNVNVKVPTITTVTSLPTTGIVPENIYSMDGKLYKPVPIYPEMFGTWLFNNTLKSGNNIYEYTIDFSSNGQNFDTLKHRSVDGSVCMDYLTLHSTPTADVSIYYDYRSSPWYDENYKSITITGGADIENETLLSWLKSNAKKTSEPSYKWEEYTQISGEIEIKDTGEYNVANYERAIVNIPSAEGVSF